MGETNKGKYKARTKGSRNCGQMGLYNNMQKVNIERFEKALKRYWLVERALADTRLGGRVVKQVSRKNYLCVYIHGRGSFCFSFLVRFFLFCESYVRGWKGGTDMGGEGE